MLTTDFRLSLRPVEAQLNLPQSTAKPPASPVQRGGFDQLNLSPLVGARVASVHHFHPLPPNGRDAAHAAFRAMASQGLDQANAADSDSDAREIATATLQQMQQTQLGETSMTLAGTLEALQNVQDDGTGAYLAKDALTFLASGHLTVEANDLYDLAVETIQNASNPSDAAQIGMAYLDVLSRMHPDATVRDFAAQGLSAAQSESDPQSTVSSLLQTFNQLQTGQYQQD